MAARPSSIRDVYIQDDTDSFSRAQREEYEQLIIEIQKHSELNLVPTKSVEGVSLTTYDVVIGTIDFVEYALKILDRKLPKPNDYPEPCRTEEYLKRRLTQGTLQDVLQASQPYFVKPVHKLKGFTGTMTAGYYDPHQYKGMSLNTKVWASSPVRFVKEYRCFVLHNELQGFTRYHEDTTAAVTSKHGHLDVKLIKKFITDFAPEAPASYVVDFGVLDTGETALIECNDGFSFGTYGFSPSIVLKMLIARWDELTA